ncbi:hypothetical protein MMB232_00003 [Brevundimonas subvibrioides]|uniref:lysozyme inhibitor LprI family protein n=1 Tax=Brevundimonas subvibrioides TaxID=74313 RepID=UPI0032D5AD28
MRTLWIVAAAMIAVAGVGGVVTRAVAIAGRGPQGLDACRSAETRAGLRDAILTRIAARGGEVDGAFAFSLDTPRLEAVDYTADRTVCGGVARMSVPEHRRAALDGVSELSDSVRFMIEPSRTGSGRVVALIGGGDVMANWLGAPPAPPAPPSPELLQAGYVAEAVEVVDAPADPEPVEEAPPARRPVERATPERTPTAARAPSRPVPTTPSTRTAPRRPVPAPPVRRADTPPPARPSFDCRRARNSAERTICADPGLADLDVAMARRYARMQNNVDGKAAQILRDEQREWLRRRDACETRSCLTLMYETRAARMDRMG